MTKEVDILYSMTKETRISIYRMTKEAYIIIQYDNRISYTYTV